MRSIGWVLGVALLSSPAFADDTATIKAAMTSSSPVALEPLLADSVKVGPMLFHDPACQKQFGRAVTVTGAERKKLAACFGMMALSVLPAPKLAFYDHRYAGLFEVSIVDHKIAAIGPFDVRAGEAALPTVYQLISALKFYPSKAVRAAIDKAKDKPVHVLAKACPAKVKGKTTARIAVGSGIAAFDKEAAAYLQTSPMVGSDIEFDGEVITGCIVWHVGAAPLVKDIVQPVKIEKQQPVDENGVEGGVEGGVGDYDGGPPPPPPPPPPPQNIAPAVLEGYRIAGSKLISPDDKTKKEIAASGRDRVIGSFKLCVTTAGEVASVSLLKSTGFPDYDAKLEAGMRTWRYKPYLVNGHAVPVCTAITFIYSAG